MSVGNDVETRLRQRVGLVPAIIFAVVNAALHFVTDCITSRISSNFWAAQDWHDQLIHQATLAFTLWVMVTR
jgi:hypothetical protein